MATPEHKTQESNSPPSPLSWIPAWAMNLWIAAILLGFFIIRVLGSGTGQRVLSRLGLRHLG
jgi:hypothetical protein